ncbi:hypothetical protein [Citrobacter amalonaticus]|uniref:hypothetical protein n=1 Tax=Citrobacter amalonaticus TaxID=35703 RepID=UPI0011AFC980|nr:hypothetical protein [Citrobacter amalonaticus]
MKSTTLKKEDQIADWNGAAADGRICKQKAAINVAGIVYRLASVDRMAAVPYPAWARRRVAR